jgi:translation elongation factor EF-1beta
LRYEPKFRCEGYQGYYVGIKQKTTNAVIFDNDVDFGVKDIDMSVQIDNKKLYEEMKAENEKLKQVNNFSVEANIDTESTKSEEKPKKVKGNVVIKP